MTEKGRDPKTGQFLKGHKGAMRLGQYSKRLPLRIRRHGDVVRAGLVRDLGPDESDLTTAKLILIDRVVSKLGVVHCIEAAIRGKNVMVGDRLAPALKESYLAYNNSIRLDLGMLGLERKVLGGIKTIEQVIEAIEKDVATKNPEQKAKGNKS